jgi:hypothetical protein
MEAVPVSTPDTPKPFLRPAVDAQMQLAAAMIVERITRVVQEQAAPNLAESILRKVMSDPESYVAVVEVYVDDDTTVWRFMVDGIAYSLSPAEAAYLKGLCR